MKSTFVHIFRQALVPVFAFALILTGMLAEADAQTKKKGRKRPAVKPAAKTAAPTAQLDVARGTEMKLRLETTINTKDAKEGDTFTATILTPNDMEGGTVYGHIAGLKESGKFKGQTQLSLGFDKVTLKDGRSDEIAAQMVEVYGKESEKKIDDEGTVSSGSQGKTTVKRTGIGAAAGAVFGAIAGGGKGAAIGAIVGSAAGAGSVFVLGKNQVSLDRGTEMLVRTTK
ncbi:MAG: YMGG-like glycine zipper-containing protein [Blastocatellia bacterium]